MHEGSPLLLSSRSSRLSKRKSQLRLDLNNVSVLIDQQRQLSLSDFSQSSSNSFQDQLTLFDPYFDMTQTRFKRLYQEIDPTNQGTISKTQFRQGLESMGISCRDDNAYKKLVASIDLDDSDEIYYGQFERIVQNLKLTDLFHPLTIDKLITPNYTPSSMTLIDYSVEKIRQFDLYDDTVQQFFLTSPEDWVSVRWLNMYGYDDLNLKRLAIKYQLHPLAIEDIIDRHERPKFNKYDNHIFIVFPMVSIIDGSEKYTRKHSSSMDLKNAFHDFSENAIEIEKRRKATGSNSSKSDNPNLPFSTQHVAIFVVDSKTVITVQGDENSDKITKAIKQRLNSSYSKLRRHDGNFLLYAILDVIVDELQIVMQEISAKLIEMESTLEKKQHKFLINRVRQLKNELFNFPRCIMKPSRDVLRNLIDYKEINAETKEYIRDVHDHVEQAIDDVELQLQMCRLLAEDYREAKANQMNYVVYTLTMVTTIFLPAQFLTGVYGMNFDNMPELHEKYGYYFFWVLVIAIGALLQLYFRYRRWV